MNLLLSIFQLVCTLYSVHWTASIPLGVKYSFHLAPASKNIFLYFLLSFYKFLSPSFRRVVIKREMMRRKTYEKFLEGVPILKCLNEDERMNVCDALIPQYFSDGEVIIKQVIMAVTKLVRMYGYPCPGRVRVGGYCSSICKEAVIKTRVLRRW